jgi:nicotinamide mononucleotide adenylyltransferase
MSTTPDSPVPYKFPAHKLTPPEQIPEGHIPCIIATCGSYNPIHKQHVEMFDVAAQRLMQTSTKEHPLHLAGGFLSPVNDHYGKKGLAVFRHRYNMCVLATEEHPWVTVDPWEGLQPEFMRSQVVLAHIHEECRAIYSNPRFHEVRLYFLCGGDLFETFYKPGCWKLALLEKIFQQFRLLVAKRAGATDPATIVATRTEPLTDPQEPGVALDLTKYSDRVLSFEMPPNNTSSTLIRNGLQSETVELSQYINSKCLAYLKENKLYLE